MKIRSWTIAAAIGTAVAGIVAIVLAQQGEKFPGTELFLTIKPSDLGADYRPLKLKEQSSGVLGDYYGSYAFQFSGLGIRGSGGEERTRELVEILPVAWTRNEMVKVYGQEFVVTYILEPSVDMILAFSQGKPLKDVELKLKLMKADQIGSIEPFPELDKERYLAILQRLSKATTDAFSSSQRSEAISNVKQVALGMLMYAGDWDDTVPYVNDSKTMRRVVEPYTRNTGLWKTLNPTRPGEFRLNMALSGVALSQVDDVANTPMLFDPHPWPDGKRVVAMVDGHSKLVPAEQWEGMKKYFKLKLKRTGKPIK